MIRFSPTVSVALFCGVGLIGSPEIEAPRGMTPPLSWPLGPVPNPGDPGDRLSQSFMICACAQLVNTVSDSCGTCLNSGSATEFPLPGPLQVVGRILFA